jgi:hypothetical protein
MGPMLSSRKKNCAVGDRRHGVDGEAPTEEGGGRLTTSTIFRARRCGSRMKAQSLESFGHTGTALLEAALGGGWLCRAEMRVTD